MNLKKDIVNKGILVAIGFLFIFTSDALAGDKKCDQYLDKLSKVSKSIRKNESITAKELQALEKKNEPLYEKATGCMNGGKYTDEQVDHYLMIGKCFSAVHAIFRNQFCDE